jgi:hypothetical protein
MRAVVVVARVVLTAILLLPLPGLVGALQVDARQEWRELPSNTRELAFAARHLRAPFDGYGPTDVFVSDFAIVALSHFACGLMNVFVAEPERRDEIAALLDEVVRRTKSPKVAPWSLADGHAIDGSTELDDHNLYLSHLGVILGIHRLVTATSADEKLHTHVARHLRARSLASPLHHAPSYPGSDMWPADQSVTLLALRLYDETHATHLVDAPLAGFLATMRERTDPSTKLFHSSVSPLDYATTPRGCATSWTTLYLAQVAPDVAREQYLRYREHMSADILGVGGFREWPASRARGMDVDSGPIVFGVGVAATGLGLGPAKMFGDVDRYTTIRRAALTFGVPSWIPSHGYVTAPILGEAILFHGRTARPWFAAAPAAVAPGKSAPFPAGVLLLVVVYAGTLARWIRQVRRSAPT